MSFTYTYSIINDFGGNFNSINFQNEIKNSSIQTNIQYINTNDDSIDVVFDSELSPSELLILNNLIQSHNPNPIKVRAKFFIIGPVLREIKQTNYEVVANIEYDGSSNIGDLNYFDLNAKTEVGNTYDARIYNPDNNTYLAGRIGMNNTDFDIMDLGIITNVPTEFTLLELQVRSGIANKKVTVQRLKVYYDN